MASHPITTGDAPHSSGDGRDRELPQGAAPQAGSGLSSLVTAPQVVITNSTTTQLSSSTSLTNNLLSNSSFSSALACNSVIPGYRSSSDVMSSSATPSGNPEQQQQQQQHNGAAPDTANLNATDPSITNTLPPLSQVRAGGAPARVYMNEKIVPYLLEGMKAITRDQPANPLRVLGEFLIQKSNEVENNSASSNGKVSD